LKKFGHSATCYIVSQKIGGINEWDIEKGLLENPLMSEDEIKKWMNGGMEIGAHTQNHIHLVAVLYPALATILTISSL
jgi:peptidoglycan/xylan/chitin deacetylase (PgdA/CDA1 family)